MEPDFDDMVVAAMIAGFTTAIGAVVIVALVLRHFYLYVYMSAKDTAVYFLAAPVSVILLAGLIFRLAIFIRTRL
jgi:hypothetical protein